jgi:hypothetical protein
MRYSGRIVVFLEPSRRVMLMQVIHPLKYVPNFVCREFVNLCTRSGLFHVPEPISVFNLPTLTSKRQAHLAALFGKRFRKAGSVKLVEVDQI